MGWDAIELDPRQVRKSMRGSFNAILRAADELTTIMQQDADTIRGVTVGDMRDQVELLTKSFHEFSAYHNVLMTHHRTNPQPKETP